MVFDYEEAVTGSPTLQNSNAAVRGKKIHIKFANLWSAVFSHCYMWLGNECLYAELHLRQKQPMSDPGSSLDCSFVQAGTPQDVKKLRRHCSMSVLLSPCRWTCSVSKYCLVTRVNQVQGPGGIIITVSSLYSSWYMLILVWGCGSVCVTDD